MGFLIWARAALILTFNAFAKLPHHPFFFPPSLLLSSTTNSYNSTMASSFSHQVEKEMNCTEKTFESSLMPEKAIMKTTPQALLGDLPMVNGNICAAGEEFFVDDLLDFSNGFDEEEEQQEEKQNRKGCSVSSNKKEETDNSNPITRRDCSSAIDDLSYIPCTELSIPVEDMENLEWLSHFVEDSFSGYPLTLPAGKLPEKQKENISVPDTSFQAEPCFTTPIQTKVRTKRATTAWHVWSLGSPSPSAESSSTSSSSSSSSATSFSVSPRPHQWLTYRSAGQAAESVVKMRPEKKNKRKSGTEGSGKGGAAQQLRCIHCGVHKTPQWRAGPLGAKTLCNACGVRYKSGRLLPEYRPACSPTFSSELHSNNHRKVLELRRKKESDEGLAPPVRSL